MDRPCFVSRRRTRLAVGAAALAATIVGASGLHAVAGGADPTRPDVATLATGRRVTEQVLGAADPRAALDALAATDRQAFEAMNAVVSTEQVEQTVPLAVAVRDQAPPVRRLLAVDSETFSGCWTRRVGGVARSALVPLYTYWQDTVVCATGSQVTQVHVLTPTLELHAFGWSELAVPTVRTANLGYEGRGLVRFHPVLGWGGSPLQAPPVCAQARLNGNGRDRLEKVSGPRACDLLGRWT